MARPVRNDVDYFPHEYNEVKAVTYLEYKYGNDGYSTFYKIFEELGRTGMFFLNINDPIERLYLPSRCKVDLETFVKIVDDMADFDVISKSQWENGIIFSTSIIPKLDDRIKNILNDLGIYTLQDEPKGDPKTYLMLDGNNYCKIGKSINPKVRESTLQSENPTINLFAVCEVNIENKLHYEFSNYRIRGEWFDLPEHILMSTIEKYQFKILKKYSK